MAVQALQQLVANAFEIFMGCVAAPSDFTGRLLFSVRRIDNGQFTGNELAQYPFAVTSIGFNPITRLGRYQGGRDNIALASHGLQSTLEYKSTYARFVTEMDCAGEAFLDLCHHLLEIFEGILDGKHLYLSRLTIEQSGCMLFFMGIQGDFGYIFLHDWFS
jgi:hypothetical protein